jgi:3-oxoacyl-ACP reductase-like protein
MAAATLAAGCMPDDLSRTDAAAPAPAAAPVAKAAAPSTQPAPPPVPAPPPPPPAILPFDEAVANAAHAVFTNAPAPDASTAMVVIDPLVDGMTGYQSRATQTIQDRIGDTVKKDFPK